MTSIAFDTVTYDKAARTAERHGTTLDAILTGIVNGYAAEDDLHVDDYMSDDMLPGESVYRTPQETRDHFQALLDEVRNGV